jgi:hypothetical protein
VDLLEERWKRLMNGSADKGSQPVIRMEESEFAGRVRRYVLWDEWDGMRQEERSKVIQEACERVLGREERLRTTVAMGLTSKEADQLRISFAA